MRKRPPGGANFSQESRKTGNSGRGDALRKQIARPYGLPISRCVDDSVGSPAAEAAVAQSLRRQPQDRHPESGAKKPRQARQRRLASKSPGCWPGLSKWLELCPVRRKICDPFGSTARLGIVFRRCAAARRPPATLYHPFGISSGRTLSSWHPVDRNAGAPVPDIVDRNAGAMVPDAGPKARRFALPRPTAWDPMTRENRKGQRPGNLLANRSAPRK